MSKKSRKKSSKSTAPAKAGAKTAVKAKAAAGQTRTTGARKSAKKPTAGASHRGTSKPLRAKGTDKAAVKSESPAASPPLIQGATEGAKAPMFHLPRDGGGTVSLSDYAGKKLVLFFYPRANTPGCTREAIDFTRLSAAFAESGTAVLGISADSVKAQDAFRDRHKLEVPLLSDEKHQMLAAYDAWGEKTLYGRAFLGIIRTTVLIGADGFIKRIWRQVKVDGHADAVLDAARSI